jgi:hypothetical protein
MPTAIVLVSALALMVQITALLQKLRISLNRMSGLIPKMGQRRRENWVIITQLAAVGLIQPVRLEEEAN